MRRGSAADNLDTLTLNYHDIFSTGNSLVSSPNNAETGLSAKAVSSDASTVTPLSTTSSSGTSDNDVANEGKEQVGAPKIQGDAATTPIVLQMNTAPRPVDEFLVQLTKMLTGDNKDYIEWRKASVFVFDPPGLEKFVLTKYFRRSNYSTFVSALLHIIIFTVLLLIVM